MELPGGFWQYLDSTGSTLRQIAASLERIANAQEQMVGQGQDQGGKPERLGSKALPMREWEATDVGALILAEMKDYDIGVLDTDHGLDHIAFTLKNPAGPEYRVTVKQTR